MALNKSEQNNFCYDNADKSNKNFRYNNFFKAKCYACDFSNSHFEYASFRGAHFKKCNFFRGNFTCAEFIGSNLKGSKFKEAKFSNTIFEGANLNGVDFNGAKFNKTIFVGCDLSSSKNLNLNHPEIKIFDSMPEFNISDELKDAINVAMENEYVKRSRIFDTKDGDINGLTFMLLSELFDEKTLIEGMHYLKFEVDKDFYTLSYVVKLINEMNF